MKQNYFIGCSGWYYTDWAGKFYPEKGSKSKWLEYYSEEFQTVEVNNTFYRFPNEKTVKGWYDRTRDDFKFTLKANQLITHRRRFKNTKSTINRFYKLAEILEDKLECILFQIPPNTPKNMEFLENAVEQMDPSKKNVIEFRDQSWFDGEVYDILNEFNIEFCSVSTSNLPEDLVITSKILYVRFHGKNGERYRYLYSKKELKEWAEKIKKSKVKEVFCYFNNDFNANAPQNAMMLKDILGHI